MSTRKVKSKKGKSKKGKQYGTLEVGLRETDDIIIQKYSCLYKNRPISKSWIIFHFFALICSLLLFIPIFVIPLTGSFFSYVIILFFISLDTIITIFACKNGVCCKSRNAKFNKIDDILMLITNFLWILSLIIAIFCGISDTSSSYTTWNRWEEFLPIFIAIFIIILLILKISIRISTNTLPFIYNTNYPNYNDNIVSNSHSIVSFIHPFKWIFFIFLMVIACTLMVHSVQKSSFINTFDDRNTQILSTENYGEFEYQCLPSSTNPSEADIRIIAIGGLSTIHLSFGWYNNLIYNEFGIKQNKSIIICDYNRGGFGFTPTKDEKDKTIQSEVKHLMEISDTLFGKNSTFHLMGHSRAAIILLMAKMNHIQRIESMIIFDGVSNANKIQYDAPQFEQNNDDKGWDNDNTAFKLIYQAYSMVIPVSPNEIITDLVVGISGADNKSNMYEADLSGKYYGMRNYMYQGIVWEVKDMGDGWKDTMRLYNRLNFTNMAQLGPVLNIECDEDYDDEINYDLNNQTLYVKTSHNPCVMDKDIANMIFNYSSTDGGVGVKAFYDSLFN